MRAWLFPPVSVQRVVVLRRIVYVWVVLDLFLVTGKVPSSAAGGAGLYQPLLLRRVLDLPTPAPGYVRALEVVIILGALAAAGSWAPRIGGYAVALAFTDWVSIAFSYGKIDHDHFALVVAVWVLPTVTGRVGRSEAAGWAVRAIQLGVVATYFLSAVAKVRFGGPDWPTGATFAWAMVRRGTWLGHHVVDPAWLLVAGQFAVMGAELGSVALLFLRGRWRYYGVAVFLLFHLSTYLLLTIHFLPLVVCLFAFLPMEDWTRTLRRRADKNGVSEPSTPGEPRATTSRTT